MKKLGIIIIALMLVGLMFWATQAKAGSRHINFEWDPCPEGDVAGYRLYQGTGPGTYIFGPGYEIVQIDSSVNTCSITVTEEGILYWVLTAFDVQGNESDPSNEVSWTVDFTKPGAPVLRFAGWE